MKEFGKLASELPVVDNKESLVLRRRETTVVGEQGVGCDQDVIKLGNGINLAV